MTYFDANTWIGSWPFSFQRAHTARSLEGALRSHRITRALVSSLACVFAPDPAPGNRALLASTRGFPGLQPVPVVNPSLGSWREDVDRLLEDPRVRAIRILPAYHGYRLRLAAAGDLLELLEDRGRRLIVSARLIDERHEYHALRIKPVPTADLDGFLSQYPRVPVLVSGLLRPDIFTLAKTHPQLLADLSFAEWHETMRHLTSRVPARQLVFASHTPFLITAAAPAKFDGTALPKRVLQSIAIRNLESFLGEP